MGRWNKMPTPKVRHGFSSSFWIISTLCFTIWKNCNHILYSTMQQIKEVQKVVLQIHKLRRIFDVINIVANFQMPTAFSSFWMFTIGEVQNLRRWHRKLIQLWQTVTRYRPTSDRTCNRQIPNKLCVEVSFSVINRYTICFWQSIPASHTAAINFKLCYLTKQNSTHVLIVCYHITIVPLLG